MECRALIILWKLNAIEFKIYTESCYVSLEEKFVILNGIKTKKTGYNDIVDDN